MTYLRQYSLFGERKWLIIRCSVLAAFVRKYLSLLDADVSGICCADDTLIAMQNIQEITDNVLQIVETEAH